MPQKVRQVDQVLGLPVKGSGKEMAEVMGKYFFQADACDTGDLFHLSPDVGTILFFSAPGTENQPCFDPVSSYI